MEHWWTVLAKAGKNRMMLERMEITDYICWNMWKARNAWLFNGVKWEPWEIVNKALQEWKEFGEA